MVRLSYSTYMDLSKKKEVADLIMAQVIDVNSRAEETLRSSGLPCCTSCWTWMTAS